jgi:hypothetical protein
MSETVHEKMRRHTLLLSCLILLCFWQQHTGAQQTIVAASRSIDWSQVGISGGIPPRSTICTTLGPGATAAQINSALAACPSGQTVTLGPGTYNLSAGIDFTGKSNVTLRGSGANQTLLVFGGAVACHGFAADVCMAGADLNYSVQPENTATWTATSYAKGQTVITMSAAANLRPGAPLILDQADDTSDSGDLVVCELPALPGFPLDCNDDVPYPQGGGTGGQRVQRAQEQIVTVVSCLPSCPNSGPTVVTFSPGLYMPNWNAARSPGAWWASSPVFADGIENLSEDHTGSSAQAGNVLMDCSGCWVEGVRSIDSDRSHVWILQSPRAVVRDSYFYGTKNAVSQSYGVEIYPSSDSLIENNIFQRITSSQMLNGAASGSVFAYNFTINDYETASPAYLYTSVWMHAGGIDNVLLEGNVGSGIISDLFHGSHNFVTAFRNRWTGWETGKADHTTPVSMWPYSRFYNLVGNVLGDTNRPQTQYETNSTNGGNSNVSIFVLGTGTVGCCLSGDPNVVRTLLRWGNYDIVSATTRFSSAEVPSGIPNFANPVPTTQTLPASFYLGAQPGWWPSVKPWPPIGPDVTGGNIPNVGGHAYTIPAQDCYGAIMGGPADGSGNVLSFNAASCYGSTIVTLPSPPTNLRIIPG